VSLRAEGDPAGAEAVVQDERAQVDLDAQVDRPGGAANLRVAGADHAAAVGAGRERVEAKVPLVVGRHCGVGLGVGLDPDALGAHVYRRKALPADVGDAASQSAPGDHRELDAQQVLPGLKCEALRRGLPEPVLANAQVDLCAREAVGKAEAPPPVAARCEDVVAVVARGLHLGAGDGPPVVVDDDSLAGDAVVEHTVVLGPGEAAGSELEADALFQLAASDGPRFDGDLLAWKPDESVAPLGVARREPARAEASEAGPHHGAWERSAHVVEHAPLDQVPREQLDPHVGARLAEVDDALIVLTLAGCHPDPIAIRRGEADRHRAVGAGVPLHRGAVF
jgi:hypothetical protein